MSIVCRFVIAVLLAFLLAPPFVQAGGGFGEDPFEIGEKLLAKGNYGTALKYYQRALKQNEARAHYRIGFILEETGKDRDALDHYRRFIDLARPEDTERENAVRRVEAIEERLKKEAARSADEKRLQKKQKTAKPADVKRVKQKTARPADDKRQKKGIIRPTDLVGRGRSLFQSGDYREAERVLLEAVAKDDSKPEAHFYLGEVYMQLEEYRKAEAEYKKAKGSY